MSCSRAPPCTRRERPVGWPVKLTGRSPERLRAALAESVVYPALWRQVARDLSRRDERPA